MGGGGVSEDSNTNQSLPSSSPPKNEKDSIESSKTTPKDEDEEIKEIDKVEPGTPMETTNEVEESLTPPLLPNMKVKSPSDEKEIEKEKENKLKRVNWDMFAEQDIFKADTSVSKILLIIITERIVSSILCFSHQILLLLKDQEWKIPP